MGGGGKWGTLRNFFLEVEILVFTNIQAISTLVNLLLDDNGFLMCIYSIFNLLYMFDFNFPTLHFFKSLNEFCSLSTHGTEIKHTDSERGRRPQCSDNETSLNLYLYIFIQINFHEKIKHL